jgi:CRP/FNR family transcriptional regulator, cyclic AMP receptor protein
MEHDRTLEALGAHPLLQRLSADQLQRFVSAGEVESYAPGEIIVNEGSLGDSIYLILSGGTEVYKEGAGGRRLANLDAGDFFGEMSLVEAAPRSASVIAAARTQVYRLPNSAIHRLAQEDPRGMNTMLIAIVRTLSQRLRRMNETVASVGQLSDWLAGSLV